ncbi:uncharacterized protein METZ01_LOCUS443962, partial [marine metagenome]
TYKEKNDRNTKAKQFFIRYDKKTSHTQKLYDDAIKKY